MSLLLHQRRIQIWLIILKWKNFFSGQNRICQEISSYIETRQETYTVVDKEAYDEPVYETHVVCKVCGQDFGKGEAASDQAGIHSAEFGHSYHSTKVQVGTKHHDAVTHQETKTVTVTPAYDETVIVKQAYDETVITGYKCSCGATK